jgi:uncharacterized protein YndB with AHSA1/START domain
MSDTVQAHASLEFNATPEQVFDAWITSKHVRNWFGPGLGAMTRVVVDAREGGIFSFVQRRGMDDVEHNGKYLEFFRPNRLAFSWQVKGTEHSSTVTVDITATPAGCKVELVHSLQPFWANYVERTTASWNKMLAAMASSIANDS